MGFFDNLASAWSPQVVGDSIEDLIHGLLELRDRLVGRMSDELADLLDPLRVERPLSLARLVETTFDVEQDLEAVLAGHRGVSITTRPLNDLEIFRARVTVQDDAGLCDLVVNALDRCRLGKVSAGWTSLGWRLRMLVARRGPLYGARPARRAVVVVSV